MKKPIRLRWLFILLLLLLLPREIRSQNRWQPYINGGYVTSLKTVNDNIKPDNGGSLRIGVLNKGLFGNGRLGFHAGYLWFNKYLPDNIEYDDSGRAFSAGIDYMLLRKGSSQLYGSLGLGLEQFISTYPASTEMETTIKPDLGLLLNIRYLNIYAGWHPSDPYHIIVGIGFTIYGKSNYSDLGY